MELENPEKAWEAKFHACLALDFSSPAYFEAHHLLVLTYMIQTDGYSEVAFPIATSILERFLEQGSDPRIIAEELGNKLKNVNLNNKGTRDLHRFPWTTTILDVRLDSAEQYRSDVRSWAMDVWLKVKGI